VARWARQPLLLAYIAAGVVIGPVGLQLITDMSWIQRVAELGLAFLLLMVGLEIDLRKLLACGRPATVAGLLQVAGSAALGWLAAVAFSSTMVVVKLLSDRSEMDTVAGRLTLAILLLQDALAVVVLAIQPNVGGPLPLGAVGLSALKGLALVAATLSVSRFLLGPLFRAVAKSPELILLSSVSWCFLVCYAAMRAGFSIAMGALLAGVSMSVFPYSLEVVTKIRSLRDFFGPLFFVSLGMLLTVPSGRVLAAAGVLSALVVASRVVTVLPALRMLGYDNRMGLLSSFHLSQISEFSLVIVLVGASPQFRHVGSEVLSLIVLMLVVTCVVSTYMIQFSHPLVAAILRRWSSMVPADRSSKEAGPGVRPPTPIMLVGCFRIGSSLAYELLKIGKEFTVIDFSPEVSAGLRKLGVPCVYGDISHADTLEHAGVQHAAVLICPIPDDFQRGTDSGRLLAALRKINPHARIILTAESVRRALELYEAGADYVVVPRLMAAEYLQQVIERAEAGDLQELRAQEIMRLEARREVVP